MERKTIKKIKKNAPPLMQLINTSPLLAGIAMIILNIGSKYVEFGFSLNQESALKSTITREIIIFVMVFVATKDIVLSIILTASFVILSQYIFNEKSRFCIMPNYLNNIHNAMDLNMNGVVSPEEERKAIEILQKANAQKMIR